MRVVRLKMYQEMARFNNPSAPKGADCYPLPPFSTVNGFIHSMCQWKRYHKLDFFVTGKGIYNTKVQKEWHGGYNFNKISDEMLKRWDVITDYADGSHTGWVSTVKYHLMLVDLYTTIYIKADDSDIDDIYHALLKLPVYPSLGEYGDLCKIEAVDIVELKELDKPISAPLDAQSYIPVNKGNLQELSIELITNMKLSKVSGDSRKFLVTWWIKDRKLLVIFLMTINRLFL